MTGVTTMATQAIATRPSLRDHTGALTILGE
jgi:hypothetical protein